MFGRKQKNTIEVTKLSSLIADNLHVVGDVLFSGGLRVDGKIEGNVLGKRGEKSLVVLSDKGCIVGRIKAYDAVINGTVNGDLEVQHFLELQAGARVSGNISYRQLQMECGATVDGKLLKVDEGAVEARKPADMARTSGATVGAGQKPVAPNRPATVMPSPAANPAVGSSVGVAAPSSTQTSTSKPAPASR